MSDITETATSSTDDDSLAVGDMLRSLRKRHIEPAWETCNRIDEAGYATLWQALAETGLTACALPAEDDGIALDATARATALAALGAALPALGAALVGHLTAQHLLVEAAGGRWPGTLARDIALSLSCSPLDATPSTALSLDGTTGGWRLSGEQRVMVAPGSHLVVAARGVDGLMACVLDPAQVSKNLRVVPSSHGLCLLPFGELRLQGITVDDAAVFPWPASRRAAAEADGLLAALLTGMLDELAQRAMAYAAQRVQAGKPISEHHAVQQLLGPIEVSRRPLWQLAVAGLAFPGRGDGSASAFAIQIVRRCALDAIQTFGGYGYMQDYRVERYLRDANTLETFWIHAAARERSLAQARCRALARGEAA